MTKPTSNSPIADENLISDIATKHGNTSEDLFDNLTSETAVGQVLLLDYDSATIAIHDYYKEKAGGLARGMFLISSPTPANKAASFVLMRVVGAKRLANQTSTDEMRLTATQESIGQDIWSNKLAKWIADEIALGGIEAHILGTLTWRDETLQFAEDIANYYSARGAYAWKPTDFLLERIVNLSHRGNSLDLSSLSNYDKSDIRIRVAKTRFAATDGEKKSNVPVQIDPTDLLKRRTAFFGMSRSGKSNAMKITAQAVYMLREKHPDFRVGQLIFDPNGEYAQDNPQDGRGLHRIHELVNKSRKGEIETYGTYVPRTDTERKITKINFFGNPIPSGKWNNREFVEKSLIQLIVGRDLIRERMSAETTRFTSNFRDADLSIPPDLADRSVATRFRRAIVVHQVALFAAGYEPPESRPNIKGLFSKKLCEALASSENSKSDHASIYKQAGNILSTNQPSWNQLHSAFKALHRFIRDSKSYYRSFEEKYSNDSSTDDEWADPRLKSVLSIFETPNGVRIFQDLHNQHSTNTSSDYADDIVDDLKAGKLVIFDQSIGDPKLNQQAAERIMWRVFQEQQKIFTSGQNLASYERHVLVYIEEAHNLLPRTGSKDVLSTVWARAAKEGGKMNLGVVLATQAPSSVLPEILSETDNWFIAHLNSDNEAKVVESYLDFAHFLPQIRRVSEPGFIRLRTLSSGYTVPVQLDRFRLPDPN